MQKKSIGLCAIMSILIVLALAQPVIAQNCDPSARICVTITRTVTQYQGIQSQTLYWIQIVNSTHARLEWTGQAFNATIIYSVNGQNHTVSQYSEIGRTSTYSFAGFNILPSHTYTFYVLGGAYTSHYNLMA